MIASPVYFKKALAAANHDYTHSAAAVTFLVGLMLVSLVVIIMMQVC